MNYHSKAGSGPRKSPSFSSLKNYAEMLAATPIGGRPAPSPGQVPTQTQNPYRTLPQTPYQAPQPPIFAAPAPGQMPTQAAPQQMPGMAAPDGVQPF